MNLKDFQVNALSEVRGYLEHLAHWRKRAWDGSEWLFDFAEKAWEKAGVGRVYLKKQDGMGRPLPVFCLKIPTGGGKTLLATHVIGLVHDIYRPRRAGLVVWIVPTQQIYQQTLAALRDRDHPYRQHLDMMTGGRTRIVEKSDAFTPSDVAENLCVLLLMLPSASRANRESLRMFRDAGAFQAFFPGDDDIEGHSKLLERLPALHTFEGENTVWRKQVKTSLGNVIQLLEPLIILDEGHRAYSETAQKTLRGLNPCMIVELSATPPKEANKLVVIGGQELLREEMIKLDLHVINKSSTRWRDTLLAAMERRESLEQAARAYEAATNIHIRPVCLIQVERTGRDQRDGKHIHAEDARDYLLGQGVPADNIAVKTAEINDLESFEDAGGLLSRDCPTRFIITKQALQEGWDCPFAYVLAILANPHSKTALTQLAGRILRQPYARKTGIPALDESYVYCFQRSSLMEEIRNGFRREGLEDMEGRIVTETGGDDPAPLRDVPARPRYQGLVENLVLPAFMIRDGEDWRLVSYEADILSRVAWDQADISPVFDLSLNRDEVRDVEQRANLEENLEGLRSAASHSSAKGVLELDCAAASAHLLDVVPNPWVGCELIERAFAELRARHKGEDQLVANNLVFILEELRKRLESERDRLAEAAFHAMLKEDTMRFMVIARDFGFNKLPGKVRAPASLHRATRLDGAQFEMNLFDPVPADDLNSLEREVATFLDTQSNLYFWFRNLPHHGYFVQGWQRPRIFADFIFGADPSKTPDCRKVFVLETKGLHLRNPNTAYKQSVFALCNTHAKTKTWNELVPAMANREITYEVVFQDEWERRLNELLGSVAR